MNRNIFMRIIFFLLFLTSCQNHLESESASQRSGINVSGSWEHKELIFFNNDYTTVNYRTPLIINGSGSWTVSVDESGKTEERVVDDDCSVTIKYDLEVYVNSSRISNYIVDATPDSCDINYKYMNNTSHSISYSDSTRADFDVDSIEDNSESLYAYLYSDSCKCIHVFKKN